MIDFTYKHRWKNGIKLYQLNATMLSVRQWNLQNLLVFHSYGLILTVMLLNILSVTIKHFANNLQFKFPSSTGTQETPYWLQNKLRIPKKNFSKLREYSVLSAINAPELEIFCPILSLIYKNSMLNV